MRREEEVRDAALDDVEPMVREMLRVACVSFVVAVALVLAGLALEAAGF